MRFKFIVIMLSFSALLFAGKVWADNIVNVPFSFISLSQSDLDWSDSADDWGTDKTSLGFTVTLAGREFSYFDMDSNGYIQLLSDYEEPSYYGYGSVSDLLADDYEDEEDYEFDNVYILAAYDDLSSEDYGYYGYKKYPDKVIFYYKTETYADSGSNLLNEFEVILYKNGSVRWNFKSSNYEEFDYGLYSGLYLTNPDNYYVAILPAVTGEIPSETSYLYGNPVPIPGAVWLIGSGVISLAVLRKRKYI